MPVPSSPYPASQSATIVPLPLVATPIRKLNQTLWDLLTRPGPLTAEEWAYIEEEERIAQLEAEAAEGALIKACDA